MINKYIFINCLCIMVVVPVIILGLSGCDKSGKILVETREYSGDESGLEYGSWTGDKYNAVQGENILNTQYINARVDRVYSDGARIIFSQDVVYPNKNTSSNNFYIEKNKTYVFIAGGGISGTEIKIRYD